MDYLILGVNAGIVDGKSNLILERAITPKGVNAGIVDGNPNKFTCTYQSTLCTQHNNLGLVTSPFLLKPLQQKEI